MRSRFRPIARRLREREIRSALEKRSLQGEVHLLRASTVQSTYRVDSAPGPLVLRWRDHRDPLDAANAEREILEVLQTAGIGRMPELRFRERTANGNVSALSFLPGQSLKGIPSPDLAADFGRRLALMHEAVRSAGLDLGTAWDAGRFRQLWEAARRDLSFPDDVTGFAESALARFLSLEASARSDPNFWGVIHSDLNASNVVVLDDEPGFIDFAEAGPGFFAWDLLMLPFDLWWDYGLDAEAAGEAVILAYASAGGGRPSSKLLRAPDRFRPPRARLSAFSDLRASVRRCRQQREAERQPGRSRSCRPGTGRRASSSARARVS